MRPSRGFGEQGNKGNLFRGTGEERPKNKGNREHRQFSGTGNIENQDFVYGKQGHFFVENKGIGTPPPPREGLNYNLY